MSRSVKKGPFVHTGLLKKIDEMNANGEKIVVNTWSRSSTIFPQMIGHTMLFMMEESMFQFISQKIWLDISLENLY